MEPPSVRDGLLTLAEQNNMSWTKPEAEVVAVTMEVTAYVATL
jgi:coenzyme PQQ precursor peptide PqqA